MAIRNTVLVSKTLYQLGVVTLLAATMWIGVSIYSAASKQKIAVVDKEILEPINPTVDQEVIKALEQRIVNEESESL